MNGSQPLLEHLDPESDQEAVGVPSLAEIKADYCTALTELFGFAGIPLGAQVVSQLLKTVSAGLLARASPVALAAVNPIATTTGICSSVGMMLSDLGRIITKIKDSEHPEEVGAYFQQALLLAIIIGVVLSLPMAFAGYAFEALGHEAEAGKVINDFFKALAFSGGMLPFIGMVALRRTLASLGAPHIAAALPVVNTALTVGGSALVLARQGAVADFAYATSASNWLSCLGFLAYLGCNKDFSRYGLFQLQQLCDGKKLCELMTTGLPIVASSTLECALVAVVAGWVGRLGSETAQAYSAVNALALVPVIPVWTLAVYLGILMTRSTVNPAGEELRDPGVLSPARLQAYRRKLIAQWGAGHSVSAGLVLGMLGLCFACPKQLIQLFAGDLPSASLLIAERALVPAVAIGFLDGARVITSVGVSGVLGQAMSRRTTIANSVGLSLGAGLAAYAIYQDFSLLDAILMFTIGIALISAFVNIDAFRGLMGFEFNITPSRRSDALIISTTLVAGNVESDDNNPIVP